MVALIAGIRRLRLADASEDKVMRRSETRRPCEGRDIHIDVRLSDDTS